MGSSLRRDVGSPSDPAAARTVQPQWLVSFARDVWRARPSLGALIVFYAAYVLAAGLGGEALALIPGVSITFWPPAGIFVATLLLTARASWTWWIVVGCCAELTGNLIWFHNALWSAAIYFSANALEALTAALLITRFVGPSFKFETPREIAGFVLFGALAAPVVGATIIATTDALLGKHDFTTAWPLVWLGDGTGLLVSTPLAFVAVRAWRERASISKERRIEAIVMGIALAYVSWLGFAEYLPTPYIVLPLILWIALRFHLRGAAAGLALVALVSAYFAAGGHGDFAASDATMHDKIVDLQAFLAVAAVSTLLVAALAMQFRRAQRELEAVNKALEARVRDRTASLAESEARFRLLADSAPILMWVNDDDAGCIMVNQAYREFVGVAQDQEVLGYDWSVFVHPEDRERYLSTYASASIHRAPFDAEFRMRRHDGAYRWMRSVAHPRRMLGGKVDGYVGATMDIDDAKAAEEALRRQERELKRAIERSDLALSAFNAFTYEFTPSTGVAYRTETVTQVAGYEPDEVESTRDGWRGLIYEDDRGLFDERLSRALAQGDQFAATYRVRHKTGRVIWVSDQARIFRDEAGVAVRMVGLVADITERKTIEDELAAQRRLYKSITDNASVALFIMDEKQQCVFMNPAAEELTGYTLQELAGRPLHDVVHHTRPDGSPYPLSECPIDQAFPKNDREQGEEMFVHKDGRFYPVAFTASPLRDADGTPFGTVIEARDISDRKHHERRQEVLIHELSHRVKNTLATVQSLAMQSLKDRRSGNPAQDFISRLTALARGHDLLAHQRWEAAQLDDVVRRALAPYWGDGRIRIVTPHEAGFWLTARQALAVTMALHELSTNAVKYGSLSKEGGHVEIDWRAIEGDKFRLTWKEIGGPEVAPPTQQGFGMRLIERALKQDFGGSMDLQFHREGVICVMEAPYERERQPAKEPSH